MSTCQQQSRVAFEKAAKDWEWALTNLALCTLCTVHCALLTGHNVLCTVNCAQCQHTVKAMSICQQSRTFWKGCAGLGLSTNEPGIVHSEVCTPCTVRHVLYSVHCAHCVVGFLDLDVCYWSFALQVVHCDFCTVYCAVLHSVLCSFAPYTVQFCTVYCAVDWLEEFDVRRWLSHTSDCFPADHLPQTQLLNTTSSRKECFLQFSRKAWTFSRPNMWYALFSVGDPLVISRSAVTWVAALPNQCRVQKHPKQWYSGPCLNQIYMTTTCFHQFWPNFLFRSLFIFHWDFLNKEVLSSPCQYLSCCPE